MRLHEAIRLGSMLGPQSHTGLHRKRLKYIFFGPVVNEYCALGAAFEAVGATARTETLAADEVSDGGFRGAAKTRKAGEKVCYIEHPWNSLMWSVVACPACEQAPEPLHRVIPHLNDHHKLTREQIADWVEGIEQEREATGRVVLQAPVEVLASRN
jgi:hypothetical protein